MELTGFSRKSTTPFLKALLTVAISPCVLINITGNKDTFLVKNIQHFESVHVRHENIGNDATSSTGLITVQKLNRIWEGLDTVICRYQ